MTEKTVTHCTIPNAPPSFYHGNASKSPRSRPSPQLNKISSVRNSVLGGGNGNTTPQCTRAIFSIDFSPPFQREVPPRRVHQYSPSSSPRLLRRRAILPRGRRKYEGGKSISNRRDSRARRRRYAVQLRADVARR